MPDKRDDRLEEEHGTKPARKTSTETGSGSEATRGMEGKPEGESHTHRSAYGGEGGEPKKPNDVPSSRR